MPSGPSPSRALGDYNRAMEDYDKSISLKPEFARTYAERGRIGFQEQGDFNHGR